MDIHVDMRNVFLELGYGWAHDRPMSTSLLAKNAVNANNCI